MATYAKILKDTSDNFILPYTRSKLVYMDDNTTVQDAITRNASASVYGRVKVGSNITVSSGTISVKTATTSALGVVKIGSNISVNSGTISLSSTNVTSALGFTPLKNFYGTSNSNNSKSWSTGASTVYVSGAENTIVVGSYNSIEPYANLSSVVKLPSPTVKNGYIGGEYCKSAPDGSYPKKIINILIGNGTSSSAKANSYRRNQDGTASGGTYSSSGADYAEYFEWEDENINNEDRRGLFVTLNKKKIKLASKDDNYILGIISGNPTVIGDCGDLYWNKMWKSDIFGALIYSENTENHLVLNPEYDPNEEYIPRSERSEWDPVGLMGKLICIDDGTCEVNGYCYPSENGIGTKSDHGYKVMDRIDDTHIQVLVR